MGFGGGGSRTPEVTSGLPPSLLPFIERLFGRTEGLEGQVPTEPFEGRFTAPVSGERQQAANLQSQIAQSLNAPRQIGVPGGAEGFRSQVEPRRRDHAVNFRDLPFRTAVEPRLNQFSAAVEPRFNQFRTAEPNAPTQGQGQQFGPTTGQSLVDLSERQARGDFLSPESNPFLQSTIEAATRPAADFFSQSVLPGVQASAFGGGASGGSREQLAIGRAGEGAQRQIGDIASQLAFGNLQAERDRQMQSGNLLNAGIQAQFAPSNALMQAGLGQEQLLQHAINEQLAQQQEQISAPFRGVQQTAGIFGSSPSTQGQRLGPSGNANLLQGLLGGAGLGLGFLGLGQDTIGGGLLGGLF